MLVLAESDLTKIQHKLTAPQRHKEHLTLGQQALLGYLCKDVSGIVALSKQGPLQNCSDDQCVDRQDGICTPTQSHLTQAHIRQTNMFHAKLLWKKFTLSSGVLPLSQLGGRREMYPHFSICPQMEVTIAPWKKDMISIYIVFKKRKKKKKFKTY